MGLEWHLYWTRIAVVVPAAVLVMAAVVWLLLHLIDLDETNVELAHTDIDAEYLDLLDEEASR